MSYCRSLLCFVILLAQVFLFYGSTTTKNIPSNYSSNCKCSNTKTDIETCSCNDPFNVFIDKWDTKLQFDVIRKMGSWRISNSFVHVDGSLLGRFVDPMQLNEAKYCVSYSQCDKLCFRATNTKTTANGVCGCWEAEGSCEGLTPYGKLYCWKVGDCDALEP
eukprot:TRINITY_DN9280_c0_g1_i2.p1 TRINITY_DN9280_c0_g1~~TRINITY_DN9280_c0_g1_i2.p1  ORF type:complete len:162 (-),score=10.72 TRINITY_DN9280_c0_g1_i2:4-489(-)